MNGLAHLGARESIDPNTKIVKTVDERTGQIRMSTQQIAINFEGQSVRSDMSYKMSAIGEMAVADLDRLMAANERKIEKIEQRYFAANSQIKTAKEIMHEQQDNFEIKEKFKDASINYPTYGRGLPLPNIGLNTFMI
jgi:hypothetical protein